MQPTQRLANQVLNVGLNTVANPVMMVSSLVNNVQLLQVKHMVEALQQVATIGAAASVLNLGVSVGGFALVLRSLTSSTARWTVLRARSVRCWPTNMPISWARCNMPWG
jgi:hypothetical protein